MSYHDRKGYNAGDLVLVWSTDNTIMGSGILLERYPGTLYNSQYQQQAACWYVLFNEKHEIIDSFYFIKIIDL